MHLLLQFIAGSLMVVIGWDPYMKFHIQRIDRQFGFLFIRRAVDTFRDWALAPR